MVVVSRIKIWSSLLTRMICQGERFDYQHPKASRSEASSPKRMAVTTESLKTLRQFSTPPTRKLQGKMSGKVVKSGNI